MTGRDSPALLRSQSSFRRLLNFSQKVEEAFKGHRSEGSLSAKKEDEKTRVTED
jgi:hypothetical protein